MGEVKISIDRAYLVYLDRPSDSVLSLQQLFSNAIAIWGERMRGNLEVVRDGIVEGWVYDEVAQKGRLNVILFVNDKEVVIAEASRMRCDVKEMGIGDLTNPLILRDSKKPEFWIPRVA